jgi:hypothetical protein
MNMRKIGILTSAVALIAFGIIIVLHTEGLVSYTVLRYVWPILIILFGVEILWIRRKFRDTPVRFSGIGILLIVIIFVLSLSQSVLSGFAGWFNGYSGPVNGQVPVDSSLKRVDIEIPNGKVTVTGTEGQEVSYDGRLDVGAASESDAGKALHSDWIVRKTDDTLLLIFNPPTHILDFGIGEFFHSSYLNVEIPNAMAASVKTSNGSVHVSVINADSDVQTSNGSITMEHVHGNITASSSNGAISLADITGGVNAHTTNGSIKGNSAVLGDWDCTTSNGAIKLDVPADTNAKFEATNSNGKIDGDVNWLFDAKHHGQAALGSGDNLVRLNTSNGGVSVGLVH